MSKGSWQRPTNHTKYAESWERIFKQAPKSEKERKNGDGDKGAVLRTDRDKGDNA